MTRLDTELEDTIINFHNSACLFVTSPEVGKLREAYSTTMTLSQRKSLRWQ